MKFTFQLYKSVMQKQYQEQESMDHKIRIIFGFRIHITLSINRHLKLKSIAHLILPPFHLMPMNVISILELQAQFHHFSR